MPPRYLAPFSRIAFISGRAAARAKVKILRNYAVAGSVPMDSELMEQVFLNLIANAAQASLTDALVTVETREAEGFAEIDIIDEGCGIPMESQEAIFNPFFTTRQEGTGLGLAIVSKIVDGHGGKIKVESEPGKGSKFSVFLPLNP